MGSRLGIPRVVGFFFSSFVEYSEYFVSYGHRLINKEHPLPAKKIWDWDFIRFGHRIKKQIRSPPSYQPLVVQWSIVETRAVSFRTFSFKDKRLSPSSTLLGNPGSGPASIFPFLKFLFYPFDPIHTEKENSFSSGISSIAWCEWYSCRWRQR